MDQSEIDFQWSKASFQDLCYRAYNQSKCKADQQVVVTAKHTQARTVWPGSFQTTCDHGTTTKPPSYCHNSNNPPWLQDFCRIPVQSKPQPCHTYLHHIYGITIIPGHSFRSMLHIEVTTPSHFFWNIESGNVNPWWLHELLSQQSWGAIKTPGWHLSDKGQSNLITVVSNTTLVIWLAKSTLSYLLGTAHISWC